MSRIFTDRYDTELSISGENSHPGCARVGISDRRGVHLEAADFPALITALYEAAGKPVPVILDRPEPHDHTRTGGLSLRREGSRVFISVPAQETPLEPPMARELAACLAACADAAEADPAAAEVAELSEEIRGALAWPRTRDLGPWPETAARAALKWFHDKQQQRGGGTE